MTVPRWYSTGHKRQLRTPRCLGQLSQVASWCFASTLVEVVAKQHCCLMTGYWPRVLENPVMCKNLWIVMVCPGSLIKISAPQQGSTLPY